MAASACVSSSPSAVLLALADQRLPTGGHVHSGGVEQAITDGHVSDEDSLAAFLTHRLVTTGYVSAAVSACATRIAIQELPILDLETDARLPSTSARAASRSQGRGLLRLAHAVWTGTDHEAMWTMVGTHPHAAIALGCSARAASLTHHDAALATAYLSVTVPATAAQRLLALDPITVAALTIRLAPEIAAVAQRAARASSAAPRDLPDDGSPWIDLLTERHAMAPRRLFAS